MSALARAEAQVAAVRDDPAARLALMGRVFRGLRDGCETVALLGGLAGEPSSNAVRLWLEFAARPTGRNWYRAHNASIACAYLEHRGLADAEGAPERFFMNVALARVLYAHSLNAAPRLALGRLAPAGRLLGDPRLGMAGAFLSCAGSPIYAWPFEERHVWRSRHMPFAARLLERVTRP